MSNIKGFLCIVLGCLVGSAVTLLTTVAFAQTVPTKVRACVLNTLGTTRIVSTSTSCLGTETMYEWDKDAVAIVNTTNAPFVCTWRCWLSNMADKFRGKNFTSAVIKQMEFTNVDLTGVSFYNAYLEGTFENSDLSNSNFSSATVSANFMYTNLQNANFTNANVINANFEGATNMNTATITGVTWATDSNHYSICPDGTSSWDNGSTCAGHLTP